MDPTEVSFGWSHASESFEFILLEAGVRPLVRIVDSWRVDCSESMVQVACMTRFQPYEDASYIAQSLPSPRSRFKDASTTGHQRWRPVLLNAEPPLIGLPTSLFDRPALSGNVLSIMDGIQSWTLVNSLHLAASTSCLPRYFMNCFST